MAPLAPRRVSTAVHGVASPPASQHNIEVDVCIVGGGIVGSCVAAALKRASRTCDPFTVARTILSPSQTFSPLPRRHLRVALVDSSWPTRLNPSRETSGQAEHVPARDGRVYAISPASRQLLQAVGAWDLLPADSVHNYDSMQVLSASNGDHA
jgi:2-polyprenyl-6-methoxyphenol hydroxylase-like FAD-dependent oxidoreductase